ncbi:hypothetical protein ACWDAZ_35595, partial [Streptomyces sp. NPDC001215]
MGVLMNASVGLLPDWARAELGMHRPAAATTAVGRSHIRRIVACSDCMPGTGSHSATTS